jgi:hypothetical protein
MVTSVAPVVCHVNVVGWPASTVFGFADSDAVGAVAGGGGGGGGATFFLHAPRNMRAPSTARSAPDLVIFMNGVMDGVTDCLILVAISCFTYSSPLFVRPHCGGDLQVDGRAHFRPAANPIFQQRAKLLNFGLSA